MFGVETELRTSQLPTTGVLQPIHCHQRFTTILSSRCARIPDSNKPLRSMSSKIADLMHCRSIMIVRTSSSAMMDNVCLSCHTCPR